MDQERSELDALAAGDSGADVTSLDTADSTADEILAADTEKIKSQIEETRGQIGETIDAIQDRLSFSNISEQVSEQVNYAVESAKFAVYEATIGKAATFMKSIGNEISGSSIVKSAAKNPLPFVLIGLGAGLLAYQGYGSGSSRKSKISGGKGQGSSHGESGNQGGESTGLTGLTSSVGSAASSAYDKVSSTAGDVYSTASDAAGQAYSKVGDLTSAATEKYEYYIEENPLAVGAVALALGAAVGMAIPSTTFESRVMGPARGQLMDKAQGTAAQLIDRTKNAVMEAGQAVTDQISSQSSH